MNKILQCVVISITPIVLYFLINYLRVRPYYKKVKNRSTVKKVVVILADIKVKGHGEFSTNSGCIIYDPKLKGYRKNEIYRCFGHELAHIEFDIWIHKISDATRYRRMINEFFCDLRGRQLSEMTDEETTIFFEKNDKRHKVASNTIESWKCGYFTSAVRCELVNKYYLQFHNRKLDINLLANDIMEKYNEVCPEKHQINTQCIIDEIEGYYSQFM